MSIDPQPAFWSKLNEPVCPSAANTVMEVEKDCCRLVSKPSALMRTSAFIRTWYIPGISGVPQMVAQPKFSPDEGRKTASSSLNDNAKPNGSPETELIATSSNVAFTPEAGSFTCEGR